MGIHQKPHFCLKTVMQLSCTVALYSVHLSHLLMYTLCSNREGPKASTFMLIPPASHLIQYNINYSSLANPLYICSLHYFFLWIVVEYCRKIMSNNIFLCVSLLLGFGDTSYYSIYAIITVLALSPWNSFKQWIHNIFLKENHKYFIIITFTILQLLNFPLSP